MAKAPNFSDILDEPVEDTEKPRPLPAGPYVCAVQTPPRMDASKNKGTKFVEFTLKPLKALDGVDADELKEQGGIGNRTLRTTFYLTPDAKFRLRKFIEDCGVDIEDGKSYSEAISELAGCQVVANVKHTPSQDGSVLYANVDSTASVD